MEPGAQRPVASDAVGERRAVVVRAPRASPDRVRRALSPFAGPALGGLGAPGALAATKQLLLDAPTGPMPERFAAMQRLSAGFFGGWADAGIMRVIDGLLAGPRRLLALTIVTALGFGTLPIAVAVGVGIVPGFARITRARVLSIKSLPYIEAARTGGASWTRVLVRHILPNSWGPVLVLAVLDFGVAILAISALSFLGFGAAPPAAEWGTLISQGRSYLITSPWLTLLPGIFVGLMVFSLNHISRSLEELQR